MKVEPKYKFIFYLFCGHYAYLFEILQQNNNMLPEKYKQFALKGRDYSNVYRNRINIDIRSFPDFEDNTLYLRGDDRNSNNRIILLPKESVNIKHIISSLESFWGGKVYNISKDIYGII